MPEPRDSKTKTINLSNFAKDYMRSFGVNPNGPSPVRSTIMEVNKLFKSYLVDGLGTKYAVNKPRFAIGAADDNDYIIDKESVSRHHATIHKDENGNFWLTDLGSTNGTYLNQLQISAPTSLKNGDQIFLADHKFTFHWTL